MDRLKLAKIVSYAILAGTGLFVIGISSMVIIPEGSRLGAVYWLMFLGMFLGSVTTTLSVAVLIINLPLLLKKNTLSAKDKTFFWVATVAAILLLLLSLLPSLWQLIDALAHLGDYF